MILGFFLFLYTKVNIYDMRIITNYNLFEKLISREELMSNVVKKRDMIEPALMTSEEYLNYLNAYKSHPDTAYQFSLSEDNSVISEKELNIKYKLINTKRHGSIYIKYYVNKGIGFKDNKYVSHDKDGNIIRDDNGRVVYMTDDEIEKAGFTFDRQIIAVHDNKIIGTAQDEWGATLVYVVKELMGIGVGEELINYYLSYYPNKDTGGTTSSGFNSLRKYHANQIKLYTRSGIYSDMIRKKEITYDRVMEIIGSIAHINTGKRPNKDNMYSKYYKHTLMPNKAFLYADTDIMMINDAILDYYKDYDKVYDKQEDVYENFIFGHCRIHEEEGDEYRLYFLDGKSEEDISKLIDYALSYIKVKYNKDSLIYYITGYSSQITSDYIRKHYEEYSNNRFRIQKDDIDTKLMSTLSRDTKWFYGMRDRYDELKIRVVENVYSTFQN